MHENLIMYKNSSRDSGKFKGCSPLQLSCSLIGLKHAVDYYFYTNRSLNVYPQIYQLKDMIVKSTDSKKRKFKGVNFEVLASGNKSMITKMIYKKGQTVPMHSHPNEQSGYVISGEHIIRFKDFNEILKPGDSYSIPENVDHSWEVIKGGEVIDVFTPPRLDYL